MHLRLITTLVGQKRVGSRKLRGVRGLYVALHSPQTPLMIAPGIFHGTYRNCDAVG